MDGGCPGMKKIMPGPMYSCRLLKLWTLSTVHLTRMAHPLLLLYPCFEYEKLFLFLMLEIRCQFSGLMFRW